MASHIVTAHLRLLFAFSNGIICSINCIFQGQLLIDLFNCFLVLSILIHELLESWTVTVAHI